MQTVGSCDPNNTYEVTGTITARGNPALFIIVIYSGFGKGLHHLYISISP